MFHLCSCFAKFSIQRLSNALALSYRFFLYGGGNMYLSILFAACTFILTACSAGMTWDNLPLSIEDEVTIFVVNHGWHTGIVIKGNELGGELSFLEEHFGESEYYELGWGDKGFYEAKEITSLITMRAILWPTESVMHVVSLSETPLTYFPHSETIAIKVSRNGLLKLKQTLAESFSRNNGQVIKTGQGIYGRSLFYKGEGSYYFANTCNTWTAKMLYATGAPIDSIFTLTASNVMRQSKHAVSKYVCCP